MRTFQSQLAKSDDAFHLPFVSPHPGNATQNLEMQLLCQNRGFTLTARLWYPYRGACQESSEKSYCSILGADNQQTDKALRSKQKIFFVCRGREFSQCVGAVPNIGNIGSSLNIKSFNANIYTQKTTYRTRLRPAINSSYTPMCTQEAPR